MNRATWEPGLVDALRGRLTLRLIAGREQPLPLPCADLPLVDRFNPIRPALLQLFEEPELRFVASMPASALKEWRAALVEGSVRGLLLVSGEEPNPALLASIRSSDTPLWQTDADVEVTRQAIIEFIGEQRPTSTVHGVLLEVQGIGVLLTGPSFSGKSELALELIERGHRLVVDDAPELHREGDAVIGRCPPLLRDVMAISGLGVIDVRALFGEGALKTSQQIDLILHLQSEKRRADGGLQLEQERTELLGVPLPRLALNLAPGHSLAVLVETAVRQHRLRLNGYDATRAFSERQRRYIDAQSERH